MISRSRLDSLERPVRFVIVGVGAMGKGLLHQSRVTPGVECLAIADIHLDSAIAAAESLEIDYRVVEDLSGVHDALSSGLLAICEDGQLLAECETADVFVEASNSIIPAAGFSISAIESGKHLVLMNSEIDLIFGPYLLDLARTHNVTYASCDGDQHGVIRKLIDDLRLWGFDLVMAGNIKGFLDRYSDPVKIVPEADKRNLDYRMATAYTDGTKLCIEMALLANAFDLRTIVPGMLGPRASHVSEVPELFDLDTIRDEGGPVVDYILGAEPDGGVFAVGFCNDAYQQSMLKYYKMGSGPYYVFYRPYHLCHVEAMAGIAAAHLDRESLLQPDHGFRTNVISWAKRDLRKGEKLEGIGGFTCYGMIENATPDSSGLPICLAEDVVAKQDIAKDSRISLDQVAYDQGRVDFDLYSRSLALPPVK